MRVLKTWRAHRHLEEKREKSAASRVEGTSSLIFIVEISAAQGGGGGGEKAEEAEKSSKQHKKAHPHTHKRDGQPPLYEGGRPVVDDVADDEEEAPACLGGRAALEGARNPV